MNIDDKELIADNKEVIRAAIKLMDTIYQRHVQRLVTEPLDENAGIRLMLIKANLDGMKTLMREFESTALRKP